MLLNGKKVKWEGGEDENPVEYNFYAASFKTFTINSFRFIFSMRKIIQTVIEYHHLVRERVLCEHLYPRMVSPLAVQRNGVG